MEEEFFSDVDSENEAQRGDEAPSSSSAPQVIGLEELRNLVDFQLGSNTIIAGPTSSGKTTLIYSIIDEGFFEPSPPQRVYVCAPPETCKTWRREFKNTRGLEVFYIEGSEKTINAINEQKMRPNSLVIFDDFTRDLDSKAFRQAAERVFHVGSHHNASRAFFVTHDLFAPGLTSLRRNTQNTILFDVTSDQQAMRQYVTRLVGQEFVQMFTALLQDATSAPHGWLRLDTRLTGTRKILSTKSVGRDAIVYCTPTSRSVFFQ